MVAFLSENKRGPFVGLVISMWQGTKKPRLATQALPFKNVSILRVVQLSPLPVADDAESSGYQCSCSSQVHMLRSWKVMSVLDVESSEEAIEGLKLFLSKDCLAWLETARSSGKWWPEPDMDTEDGDFQPILVGAKRKRKRKGKGDAKHAKNSDQKKKTKTKKKKKEKQPKAKKIKAKSSLGAVLGSPVDFDAENFRKNDMGRKLIKQTMVKLFEMDNALFQDKPLFDHKGCCRLKGANIEGQTWSKVLSASSQFFNMESLGLYV